MLRDGMEKGFFHIFSVNKFVVAKSVGKKLSLETIVAINIRQQLKF